VRQLKCLHEPDTFEISAVVIEQQPLKNVKLPKLIDIVTILLPLCSLFLWVHSLNDVNTQNMNDLGLISVFSPLMIISLVVVTISFCLALRQPRMQTPIVLLHLLLLVFMLYNVTTFVEQAPRFTVVYKHAGLTEYIMRTGSVDPDLDAYFSWPGFFILSAFVTQIAGYHSALDYAVWAPFFFNLIYLGPLYSILTTATTDKRLVWLSVWFFYLTNWIGQDYFSPQGLNYFLYLVIIAILLKWFKVPSSSASHAKTRQWLFLGRLAVFARKVYDWAVMPDLLLAPSRPQQRVALFAILLCIFAFVVFSHPLTPFFVLASVTALIFLRRCTPFWLPFLMGAMTVAWIVFMTRSFLVGHASMVVGSVGHVSGTVSANVTSRVVGSAEHAFVAQIRIIMTVTLWILAFLGGVRRLWKGNRDGTYILLAVTAFPLVVMQQYGGEMLLRVYLFSLPAMVFFTAALFFTSHRLSIRGVSPWITLAFISTSLFLIGGLLVTRYGNERADYMTYAEVDSMHYLYNVAKPHALFIQAWADAPWQFQDFEKVTCTSLKDEVPDAVTNGDVNAIVRYVARQRRPQVFIAFTRVERASIQLYAGYSAEILDRLEQMLLRSGKFKLVYSNTDAQVLLFIGSTKGGNM